MIFEAGIFGLGFGLGVTLTSIQNRAREKDLLDRISWRNPEDYFFMKFQRDSAVKKKSSFKIPEFGFLKKKKVEAPSLKLDEDQNAERLRQHFEKTFEAQDENRKNYEAYHEGVSEMAKAGVSNP